MQSSNPAAVHALTWAEGKDKNIHGSCSAPESFPMNSLTTSGLQEHCHWLQIGILPTKYKNQIASALRILPAKNCKEIDKIHFHLNLSKKEMMGSGVLPGLEEGEGNQ